MVSVINLDSSVTNSDLYDLFITAGEVIWSEVRKHKDSGLSLGYGYVSYSHPEHGTNVTSPYCLFLYLRNSEQFSHLREVVT